MTNLNISIERLIPIAELIESVDCDQSRIVISKVDLWNSELRLTFKVLFKEQFAKIELTPAEATDLIDETKGNYAWLRNTANETQRASRLDLIRAQLLCLASDLVGQYQYA